MMNSRNSKVLALTLMLLLAALMVASVYVVAPVAAQADTDWPMFRHDSALTGISGSTAPDKFYSKWRHETGGPVPSSPAVVAGKVYVGSYDKYLYCLDGNTGSEVWKYQTGGVISSSPSVAAGKVYFGSWDGNLYCLDAATGSLAWKYQTGGAVASSPNVAAGNVYFGSFDKNVYALNATTGAKTWNYTTGNRIYTVCPSVVDGKVYIGSMDTYLYSLNSTTGTLVWRFKATNSFGASSAVVADNRVYVGCDDQRLYCLNATTGTQIWRFNSPDLYSQQIMATTVTVTGGKVYAGFYGGIFVLDAVTGNQTLVCGTGHVQRSSAAIVGGKIYVGCNDLVFYVFDAASGNRVQSYFASGPWESSPAIAGGKIYIGNGNGYIYCFDQVSGTVPVTISCTARPASQAFGYQVTVEGHIFPGVSYVSVDLMYSKPDGTTMTKTVSAGLDAKFSHSFEPDQIGTWTVTAQFNGFDIFGAAESSAVSFTVTGTAPAAPPAASAITCSASRASNGDLSVKGAIMPAVSGATVTLTYYKPDATSITRTVTAGSDGTYTDSYTPDMTGNWLVRASWAGNSAYTDATSIMSTVMSTTAAAGTAIDWVEVIIVVIVIVILAVLLFWYMKSRKK